ncbi:tetratricopeptide repeat protein [Streptomyces sp. NPDC006208]|uniref:tetratricopeptide repeat protein n=1 Tax=Streptomyces sp. NPDC006208 TaxID=3156734 RepID=UPI0033B697BF
MFPALRRVLLLDSDRSDHACAARRQLYAAFNRPDDPEGGPPFAELARIQLRLIHGLWPGARHTEARARRALTAAAGVHERLSAAGESCATTICVLQELVERLVPDDPDGLAPQPSEDAAGSWITLIRNSDDPSQLVRTLGDRLAELVPVLSEQDHEDEGVLAAEAVVLLRRPLSTEGRVDESELRALRHALLAYEGAFEAAGCFGAALGARLDGDFTERGLEIRPRDVCRTLWARARRLGMLDSPAEAPGAYAGILAAHRRQAAGEDREQAGYEIAASQAQLAWAAVTAALALSPAKGAGARAAAEEAFDALESVPYRKPFTALVRALYREALWRSDQRSPAGPDRLRAAGFLSALHPLIGCGTETPVAALGHALVRLIARGRDTAAHPTPSEEALAHERSREDHRRYDLLLDLTQAADSLTEAGQPPREQALRIAGAVVDVYRWVAGLHSHDGSGYGGEGDDCLDALVGPEATDPYADLRRVADALSRLAALLNRTPGRRADAVAPMEEAVARYRELTEDRWERHRSGTPLHALARGLNNLAFYIDEADRPEEAHAYAREAVALSESLLPGNERSHAIYEKTLADILEHLGGAAPGSVS